ncbi:hypothetical protein [Priestia megaterium]|uniref:hypothetical protein n=1 Tax=Priestia megaterium TaxID=1404 RepID=UPI002795666B|nr:hypothetical protein [Priestia megaterium]
MSNNNKFKEILENKPFFTIVSIAAIAIVSTWSVSEAIRVNPLKDEIARQEDEIKDYKSKVKNYKEQSEFDRLVVYDSDKQFKEDDTFYILGGQVSIKVTALINPETVAFEVDAPSEPKVQSVDTYDEEGRATFKYLGDRYIINVKNFSTDEDYDTSTSLSVSKVKE